MINLSKGFLTYPNLIALGFEVKSAAPSEFGMVLTSEFTINKNRVSKINCMAIAEGLLTLISYKESKYTVNVFFNEKDSLKALNYICNLTLAKCKGKTKIKIYNIDKDKCNFKLYNNNNNELSKLLDNFFFPIGDDEWLIKSTEFENYNEWHYLQTINYLIDFICSKIGK